jgi:hypothetical protein
MNRRLRTGEGSHANASLARRRIRSRLRRVARARRGGPDRTLDQAKIARLPAGATTLIIGNPMIADVTMLKNNKSMVITGKGFGQTNLIAVDAEGSVIVEEQVRVLPAKTVLVLQNGNSRISYACNPQCMPTVQLGDDDKSFKDAGEQISNRNGYAAGGPGAPAK